MRPNGKSSFLTVKGLWNGQMSVKTGQQGVKTSFEIFRFNFYEKIFVAGRSFFGRSSVAGRQKKC